jgi:serralysin
VASGSADGYGNALDNRITAGAGNNRIDGGAGSDTAQLRDGHRRRQPQPGLATAQATGGFGQRHGDELRAPGGQRLRRQLGGNAGDNLIEGGAGNDTLSGGRATTRSNGGAGADSLSGGDGNDVYTFDNAGDVIVEAPRRRHRRSARLGSHVLAANLENLTILAAGAADGYGNALDNLITAGAGNNRSTAAPASTP